MLIHFAPNGNAGSCGNEDDRLIDYRLPYSAGFEVLCQFLLEACKKDALRHYSECVIPMNIRVHLCASVANILLFLSSPRTN
jgi:hypothetical protein